MQRHANMSLHEYSISMPVNMNVVAIVVIIIQAHKRKNKKKKGESFSVCDLSNHAATWRIGIAWHFKRGEQA